jgi:hypothetical protein
VTIMLPPVEYAPNPEMIGPTLLKWLCSGFDVTILQPEDRRPFNNPPRQ